ncbi:butyrophilin subfamily 3 member A1-like isoform X2 [Oncorhynchus kisutch]|uniref:butyrophilin subfamily 3 member A1-like isoform X2 n=1 Tax=Oncorhynchus kisutch TaxID=8019 RepID=UPI0012DE5AA5|nr:butyrophilin subfamily 3 member A1-like isoform X2 [Oncorhynchus kisutch]
MDPRYRSRVSPTGGLERGNVSLTLERVTLEDRGEYVCRVSSEQWYEKASVSLTLIVLGGIPVLSLAEARGGGGQVNITCPSVGWSPQPKLTWKNKGAELRNVQEVLYTHEAWREAFIAYLVLSLLLLSALASVVIMLGKQRKSLAWLSSQKKGKGSPEVELEQRPDTRHLIEEAGHIDEKQPVEKVKNRKLSKVYLNLMFLTM